METGDAVGEACRLRSETKRRAESEGRYLIHGRRCCRRYPRPGRPYLPSRSRRTSVLDSEVLGERQLDLGELISSEEVDGVARHVVDVDRPDLVDQEPSC